LPPDDITVVVTGAGDEVEGFGGGRGVEDGTAEFHRDDVVLLAMNNQDRHPERVESFKHREGLARLQA
jgi:hypothetical protein